MEKVCFDSLLRAKASHSSPTAGVPCRPEVWVYRTKANVSSTSLCYASAGSSLGTGVALLGGPLGGPPILGGGGTLDPFVGA